MLTQSSVTSHSSLCPPPGCSDPLEQGLLHTPACFALGMKVLIDTGLTQATGESHPNLPAGDLTDTGEAQQKLSGHPAKLGTQGTGAQAAVNCSQSATSYQKRHLTEHRDWKRQRGVPGGSRRPRTPCLWSCSAHSTLESALSEPLTHTLIYSCGFSRNRNSENKMYRKFSTWC